jgi:hypothetical protein
MNTLTIACPEQHIAIGNQFARCVGLDPDDDRTFGLPLRQDASGNLYAVAAGLVSDTFEQAATSPLVAPEWGCDMEAAQRAQALIRLPDPETGELTATPDILAAMFGTDPMACIAALGLSPAPDEGDGA